MARAGIGKDSRPFCLPASPVSGRARSIAAAAGLIGAIFPTPSLAKGFLRLRRRRVFLLRVEDLICVNYAKPFFAH
jgi:hypothetical protein